MASPVLHSPGAARDLQHYLHAAIPLSAAMGMQVREASPQGVLLWAPLAPNINHSQTVFGGSGVVLATLSAWALLHLRLQAAQTPAQLVIQRSAMEYERPISGDFAARCEFSDELAWRRFQALYQRRGRARLTLHAQLCFGPHVMGRFVGDFVALREA
ncbi:MAG: YiiD C-terminal domain-containing protein [Sinobacteraceae bacterium]|nr:YiiD C-terminal domain-containing protein [Nevskiaceae bacterium]